MFLFHGKHFLQLHPAATESRFGTGDLRGGGALPLDVDDATEDEGKLQGSNLTTEKVYFLYCTLQ